MLPDQQNIFWEENKIAKEKAQFWIVRLSKDESRGTTKKVTTPREACMQAYGYIEPRASFKSLGTTVATIRSQKKYQAALNDPQGWVDIDGKPMGTKLAHHRRLDVSVDDVLASAADLAEFIASTEGEIDPKYDTLVSAFRTARTCEFRATLETLVKMNHSIGTLAMDSPTIKRAFDDETEQLLDVLRS